MTNISPMTWSQAKFYCETQLASLIKVKDQETLNKLTQILDSKKGNNSYWIGEESINKTREELMVM